MKLTLLGKIVFVTALVLLVSLIAGTGANAHKGRNPKVSEYEYLDRLDGYNDNCVVIDRYAHCLEG